MSKKIWREHKKAININTRTKDNTQLKARKQNLEQRRKSSNNPQHKEDNRKKQKNNTSRVTELEHVKAGVTSREPELSKNAKPPNFFLRGARHGKAGRGGAGRGTGQRQPPPMVGGGGTWWAARRSTTRGETVLPTPPPRLSLSPLISSPRPRWWPARLEGTGESEPTRMARCGGGEGQVTRQGGGL